MYDPRKHNYFKKVLELLEKVEVVPGRIAEVDVYHDDGCALYRGEYCDCEPEVRLRPPPEWN